MRIINGYHKLKDDYNTTLYATYMRTLNFGMFSEKLAVAEIHVKFAPQTMQTVTRQLEQKHVPHVHIVKFFMAGAHPNQNNIIPKIGEVM
jgi:hypothetical protein